MDHVLAAFLIGWLLAAITGAALLALGSGLILSMILSYGVWIAIFVFAVERLSP